jgi:hypothetical protein
VRGEDLGGALAGDGGLVVPAFTTIFTAPAVS